MKKTHEENFALNWILAILGKTPFLIAKKLLIRLKEIHDPRRRWAIIGVLVSTSVLLITFFQGVVFGGEYFLKHIVRETSLRWSFRILFYCSLYLIVTCPLVLLLVCIIEKYKEKLITKRESKKEPQNSLMKKGKEKSTRTKTYLGSSFHTHEPIYLTDYQRLMHAEVVGSTGTGKTESVLLPLLEHDIGSGKGAIVIDGKGDLELRKKIERIACDFGRSKDLLFFSLSHPKESKSYNPLFWGNATELKDKIIGSTSWGEEFYRKMAEKAALCLLNALTKRNEGKEPKDRRAIRFSELHRYLTQVTALSEFRNSFKEGDPAGNDLDDMVKGFKDQSRHLQGLIADLYLYSKSEFSGLIEQEKPEIDLLDVYKNAKIVYFQLDLQRYQETAKRMGRMIVQDIRSVSGQIQHEIDEDDRRFFPVFIDDAASFLDVNFIDFLNKCRASKLAITLIHQSPGDLVYRRDTSFQQQIIENTNIKIILRQDDPGSVEKMTKIGGTRRTLISTYQTEEKILGKELTGVGSVREGQAFRVDPDQIRALERGEAIIIWKSPHFHTDFVKLDYYGRVRLAAKNMTIKKEIVIQKEKKPGNEAAVNTEVEGETAAGNHPVIGEVRSGVFNQKNELPRDQYEGGEPTSIIENINQKLNSSK